MPALLQRMPTKQRSVPGAEWEAKEDAGRSVEYLAVLDVPLSALHRQ